MSRATNIELKEIFIIILQWASIGGNCISAGNPTLVQV
jgi:hypothetical protein